MGALELLAVERHPGYGQPLGHGPFLAVLGDEHIITAPDDVAPSRISGHLLRRSLYKTGPVLVERQILMRNPPGGAKDGGVNVAALW